MSKTKAVKDNEKDKETENESQSYQLMLEEVEGIVRTVSGGPMDLDEVVSRVERGYKLIKTMRQRLDTTKARVEKLRTEFENDATPNAAAVTDSEASISEDMPF